MSNRHRYLIAYDICDQKRLQRIRLIMEGYGERIQYSVFLCDLATAERNELERRVLTIMNSAQDSVIQIDLGPAAGAVSVRTLGRRRALPTTNKPLIV